MTGKEEDYKKTEQGSDTQFVKDSVDKTQKVDKPVIKENNSHTNTEQGSDTHSDSYDEKIKKKAKQYIDDPNEDREYREMIDKKAKEFRKYIEEDAKKKKNEEDLKKKENEEDAKKKKNEEDAKKKKNEEEPKKKENEEDLKKKENEEDAKKEENEDSDISLTPEYKEICDDLSRKQEDYDNILDELKQIKTNGQVVLRNLNSPSTGTAEESTKVFLQNKLDRYKDRYEELREDFCDTKAELCELRNQKAKMLDSIDIESVFGITSDKIPGPIGYGQGNVFIVDPHNKETSMFVEDFQNKTCLTRDEALLFTRDDNGNIGRKVNYKTLEECDLDGNRTLDRNEINAHVKYMLETYPDAIKVFDAKESIRNELGIEFAEKGDEIPSSYKYGFIKGTQNYESSPDDRYYVDFNATKFGGNDFYNFIKDPETGNVDPKHVDEFYNRYNLDDLDSLEKLKEDMNSGKTLSDFDKIVENKQEDQMNNEQSDPISSGLQPDNKPINQDDGNDKTVVGKPSADGSSESETTQAQGTGETDYEPKSMQNSSSTNGMPTPSMEIQ